MMIMIGADDSCSGVVDDDGDVGDDDGGVGDDDGDGIFLVERQSCKRTVAWLQWQKSKKQMVQSRRCMAVTQKIYFCQLLRISTERYIKQTNRLDFWRFYCKISNPKGLNM